MPTDAQLLARRLALPIRSDGQAAEILANELGLSVDSVRGRLSRTRNGGNWIEVIKAAALDDLEVSPAVARQEAVIARSNRDWAAEREVMQGYERTGLFISDVHFPYARWDALELVRQLVEHIQPNYISGQNDLLDNEGHSRWPDDRTARGQQWSSDISSARAVESAYYQMLSSASPLSQIVSVNGNHDNWWFKNKRENDPLNAESEIADYLEWLYESGVLVFSDGRKQVDVEMSDVLVWSHGFACQKKAEARAAAELEVSIKDGRLRSKVVGHTHRPAVVEGYAVRMPGVRYYNAPCLCRLEAVPYMDRDPNSWGLGVVFNRFTDEWEEGEIIRFYERKGSLETRFEGITFDTPINKDAPKSYR